MVSRSQAKEILQHDQKYMHKIFTAVLSSLAKKNRKRREKRKDLRCACDGERLGKACWGHLGLLKALVGVTDGLYFAKTIGQFFVGLTASATMSHAGPLLAPGTLFLRPGDTCHLVPLPLTTYFSAVLCSSPPAPRPRSLLLSFFSSLPGDCIQSMVLKFHSYAVFSQILFLGSSRYA